MNGRLSIQESLYPDMTCWGCGHANPHGFHLRSYREGELTVAEFTPRPEHDNGFGAASARAEPRAFDEQNLHCEARFRSMNASTIPSDAPAAVELLLAVRAGEIEVVRRLVSEHPELAVARIGSLERGTGTALHFVTDWPGYFPNGPDIVHVLADAGADPNALTTERGSDVPTPGSETPLHYAASSDDVDVAAALIDRGADLETPDGSIGTPLDNAVGYACWHVARLLVMRGARVEKIWHASALGMLDRLENLLVPGTDLELISQGFWHACAAGERRAAERLLREGADLDWEPDYAQGRALDTAMGRSTRQENVIEWLQSLGARPAE